ncbi:MAG: hypothetical protein IH586_01960 [Anaerolineaceae bacterium]|nr:hypothetical protein [Anaerolineaceae bacterium]
MLNEINHTMEFHTLAPMTGIDVPGIMVDFAIAIASGKITPELPTTVAPRLPQGFLGFSLPAFTHTQQVTA